MTMVIVFGAALAFVLLSFVFGGKKSDPHAEFRLAKDVLSRPKLDAETGEYYAYKITRVPAQEPMAAKPPMIVDGKAAKS